MSTLLSLILKIVRNGLGYVIIFFDWVSRPKPIQRSATEQETVQSKFTGHSLYQLTACPFCVKTRRAIHSLGIDLEIRDLNKVSANRTELENGGGKVKVPCLRIDSDTGTEWMYESNDIIAYLQKRAA